jgi:hypothetical protein
MIDENLHEEAFNDHCFDCGIELNKNNESIWECFRQLNNKIVQAKICIECEKKQYSDFNNTKVKE